MSQRRHATRLLVAAITTLLMGSLAGASGLVLCVNTDGHSAIELEHRGTGCPTLASLERATGVSTQSPVECSDFPAVGAGPIALSSFVAERAPMPPTAVPAVHWVPAPIEARIAASTDARAEHSNLAPHLTSTVLLV